MDEAVTALLERPEQPWTSRSLRDALDEIAARLNAWILVDRRGEVLAHATGPVPCPPPVVDAIVTRDTSGLQRLWSARATQAGGLPARAAGAGDGLTVWSTADAPHADDLAAIRTAAVDDHAARDPEVAALLAGLGPRRAGSAPQVTLVALRVDSATGTTVRAAMRLRGPDDRVHVDHPWLYLALAGTEPAEPTLAALAAAGRDPLGAGVAQVPPAASDWRLTGDIARRLADVAQNEGLTCLGADSPRAAQRLVVDEAVAAAQALVANAGLTPLDKLRQYDQRSGGALEQTLWTWLDAGCELGQTSAALHVHNNTLRYRLRRAAAVSGFDLQCPEARQALWLLLRAERSH